MSDRYFIDRPGSKWIMVTIDSLIVLLSFLLTSLLMNDFRFKMLLQEDTLYQLPVLMAAYLTGFIIFKPFKALTGLTGLRDIGLVFYSVITGALLIFISNLLLKNFTSIHLFSLSVLVINVAVTLYIMTLSRLIIRYYNKTINSEIIKKLPVQSAQLRKNSTGNYPVELLVFNALN